MFAYNKWNDLMTDEELFYFCFSYLFEYKPAAIQPMKAMHLISSKSTAPSTCTYLSDAKGY